MVERWIELTQCKWFLISTDLDSQWKFVRFYCSQFNSEAEEEAGTVGSEAGTISLSRTLEKSLNNTTRYSINITAKDVESQRKKRDVVTDDGPLAGFAIYDALSEDGKSLRRESHVTKKHGKRRRHRRCKKRFGCSRSANRNNNNRKNKHNGRKKKNNLDDIKIIIPFETRKWFQYQSHSNRNLQTQVLVGNRSLALFRQQLAAAAAADAIKSSTAVTDRSIYSTSTKVDDFLIDTTFVHPRTSTPTTPKSSEKHKNKNKNPKDKSGRKNDRKTKNKHEKIDNEKNAAKVLPDVSSVTNVSEPPRNASIIEDPYTSDIINYEQEIVVKRVPRTKSMDAK